MTGRFFHWLNNIMTLSTQGRGSIFRDNQKWLYSLSKFLMISLNFQQYLKLYITYLKGLQKLIVTMKSSFMVTLIIGNRTTQVNETFDLNA